jgi:hypothetical protein
VRWGKISLEHSSSRGGDTIRSESEELLQMTRSDHELII